MRRGRTILIILVIIVLLVIAAVVALRVLGGGFGTKAEATPTPSIRYVDIVTAGQNIPAGAEITEQMLGTMQVPESMQIAGEFTDKNAVIGQFAKMPISQSLPIMDAYLSPTPGISTSAGSPWASQIPQGLTAVSIPITRLNLVGYGVRDNDFVNIIVTVLMVDIDPSYQSILPNHLEAVTGPGAIQNSLPLLTASVTNDSEPPVIQGRAELDATLASALYVIPGDVQRPRMVTQMIMQNVQVLHVGSFLLPGEEPPTVTIGEGTPTAEATTQTVRVIRPDIVTLMVTPQDAVVLTYLLHSGADITLSLRNPNDFDFKTTTDAATLQYLLSQYNIPVPAKLPYALQPSMNELKIPVLPNDLVITPAQQ